MIPPSTLHFPPSIFQLTPLIPVGLTTYQHLGKLLISGSDGVSVFAEAPYLLKAGMQQGCSLVRAAITRRRLGALPRHYSRLFTAGNSSFWLMLGIN